MQIHIKVINGADSSIDVLPNSSIRQVKDIIASKLNIPINHQRLMLKGKPLPDGGNLQELGIGPDTKIHLIVKKDESENKQATTATTTTLSSSSNVSFINNDACCSKTAAIESKLDGNDLLSSNEFKIFGKQYFDDVDQFVEIFNKELRKLVNEMSLDDIERYNEERWKNENLENNKIEDHVS